MTHHYHIQASKSFPVWDDPELLELQPTLNIGSIGHVAHGKSTLVEALTRTKTAKSSSELKKNMTIKLGYANVKIYECDNPLCPRPERFAAAPSSVRGSFPCRRIDCGGSMRLVRHISFVDCPGHEVLMQTMLNGAAVMDAAMLVVAADRPCPEPQTLEHLAAIGLMGCKEMFVVQNKIDLVDQVRAIESYEEIQSFLATCMGSRESAQAVPIIPCAAIAKLNVDVVCERLAKIPAPPRHENLPPKMIVIRSFDVNLPGASPDELVGGVAGGSLLCGHLSVGQKIEIRPGLVSQFIDPQTKKKTLRVQPLLTTARGLFSESNSLKHAVPGGLIAVGTGLDSTLTAKDRLVGHILGVPGSLPDVFIRFEMSYALIKRAVTAPAQETPSGSKPVGQRERRAPKLIRGEKLQLNVNSRRTIASVIAIKADLVKVELDFPCCISSGQRISICRKVGHSYRLSGIGIFQNGQPMKLHYQ